jgi:hypothetical protein
MRNKTYAEAKQELTEYKRKLMQNEPDEKFIDIDYAKEIVRLREQPNES